jgi:hypothetical protein
MFDWRELKAKQLEEWKASNRAKIRQQIADFDHAIVKMDTSLAEIGQQMRARNRDIWNAERSINEWIRAGEKAREETREIARDLFMDLSKGGMKETAGWAVKRIPPDKLDRIKKKIDEYTRKGRAPFRKIEPYNPLFLAKAYETIKHLREARIYYDEKEYDQAVGAVLEAANTAFPTKYSELITISYKGGRLWIANFYAFTNYSAARQAADQMSAVQGADLEAIKSLSKTYELRMNDKQRLMKERRALAEELHKYD